MYKRKASIGGLGILRGLFETVGGSTMNPIGAVSGEKYDALMATVPVPIQLPR
jgi:hypothetical protein